eukprot:756990_1
MVAQKCDLPPPPPCQPTLEAKSAAPTTDVCQGDMPPVEEVLKAMDKGGRLKPKAKGKGKASSKAKSQTKGKSKQVTTPRSTTTNRGRGSPTG